LNVTVNEKGAKTVLIRGTGNEKARITVMLGVLTDGRKLPPCVYLVVKNNAQREATSGPSLSMPIKGLDDQ
jgi:hypothetical protein